MVIGARARAPSLLERRALWPQNGQIAWRRGLESALQPARLLFCLQLARLQLLLLMICVDREQ